VRRIRLAGRATVNPELPNDIDVAYLNQDNGGSSFRAVVGDDSKQTQVRDSCKFAPFFLFAGQWKHD
jgi:hypothetical protein